MVSKKQSVLAGIFSHTYTTDHNIISDLAGGTEEAFVGNPIKAMKHKRKTQFNEERNINSNKVFVPKGLSELVNDFKIEVSCEEEEMAEFQSYIDNNYE